MDISIYLLLAISVVLFSLTSLLFFSVIIIRFRHRRWTKKVKQYKKDLLPPVLEYLEEGGDISNLEKYFHNDKSEYYAFVKIVTNLLSQLEGPDADRLQELLYLDPIFDHYYKLLNSRNDIDRVKACIYFSHVRLVNYKVIKKLEEFLNSSNMMLVFSAATALMGSEDVKIRAEALNSVAKMKGISDMALLELFHKFHSGEDDQLESEGEVLKEVISNPSITPENRALLILGVAERGYYNMVEFLLDKLKKPIEIWDNPDVLHALIKAQGEFYNVSSVDTIRQYLTHEHPKVVIAAIEELSDYGSEKDLTTYHTLLTHADNEVRQAAVFALINNDQNESQILSGVPDDLKEEIRNIILKFKTEKNDQ
ncbi:MAG: HEAT repeat domain-containing protein [Balneolaceae bacterium]